MPCSVVHFSAIPYGCCAHYLLHADIVRPAAYVVVTFHVHTVASQFAPPDILVVCSGDYVEVESALSETERIIDDIFAKINLDKYRRTPKWLQGMSFDGIDVVPLQNEKNALYGWMAEVMLQTPYCITDNNAFKTE